jgi:gas vesicle protein
MPLKAMLETIDDLPDNIQEMYAEQDIKLGANTVKRFVLQVDGVQDHPQVKNLQTAHERQKELNRTIKAENEQLKERFEGLPEDFSPDMFNDLKNRAEDKGGNNQEVINTLKSQLENKHGKEKEKLDNRIKTLENAIRTSKVDEGLNQALIDAGVEKGLLAGARSLIKDMAKLELIEEDGRFDARINGPMGQQTLRDFVSEWVGTDEGKLYVAKPKGDDANGSEGRPRVTGDNPFNRKDGAKPNKTLMQEAWVNDPAKARQMAKAAGWNDRELQAVGFPVQ